LCGYFRRTCTIPGVFTIEDTQGPIVEVCVGTLNQLSECSGGNGNQETADEWHAANLERLMGCAEDLCNPDTVFTYEDDYDWANFIPDSGDCTGGGTLTVNYQVKDDCGNLSENIVAVLTLEDTSPPVIELCVGTLDQTEECQGDGNEGIALAWHQANLDRLLLCATDECNPNAVFTTGDDYDWANFVPNTGDCAGGGTLTVNYTVSDNCGFESDIIPAVLILEDTTPPIVELCVGTLDQISECAGDSGNETIALDWHQANLDRLLLCAVDECNPDTVFTTNDDYDWANYVPNTGDCTAGGTLTVNYTVTDGCGFESQIIPAILKIEDTTPPIVELCGGTLDRIEECAGANDNESIAMAWHAANFERLQGCAEDNCSPDAVFTIVDDYDWANYDTTTSCGDGGTLMVNYQVTDNCGNLSVIIPALLTIEDTTGPELVTTLETPISVVCTEVPEVPELEFIDGCTDEDIVMEFEEVNGDEACYDDGSIDLFDFLPSDTDTSGEWVIVTTLNDDIEIVDGIFDPSELDQAEDLGDYVFSYTVTKGYCLENTEVTITINDECVVKSCGIEDFTISKALTPNGDEYNEFFKITTVKECQFKVDVKIFNRYGAIVYQNDNYQNDWNANTHSASIGGADQLPNGTYYYVVVVTGEFDGGSGLKPLSGPLFIGTDNR